jgi:hypothetical protein
VAAALVEGKREIGRGELRQKRETRHAWFARGREGSGKEVVEGDEKKIFLSCRVGNGGDRVDR